MVYDPKLLFEGSLKVALAGKAQKGADCTDWFICKLKQTPSLFKLAPENKVADGKSKIFLKVS